jgi:predicted nucleotide-binding protein
LSKGVARGGVSGNIVQKYAGNAFLACARKDLFRPTGLFLGKLGAEKVCLAKKGDIEIPTDISGVIYLDLDDGSWKLSLAQKLKKAGLSIDLDKLL